MIEDLITALSPHKAALGIFFLLVTLYWVLKLQEFRKIKNLGGRAPATPTYLPLG
jgi:hypothetical protein